MPFKILYPMVNSFYELLLIVSTLKVLKNGSFRRGGRLCPPKAGNDTEFVPYNLLNNLIIKLWEVKGGIVKELPICLWERSLYLAKAFPKDAPFYDIANCGKGRRGGELNYRFTNQIVVGDVLILGDIAKNLQAHLLGQLFQ